MTEINETLDLNHDKLVLLNRALKAYNSTSTQKISFSDITVKPEIDASKVTFAINSNSNYTEKIVYNVSNGTVSKVVEIGNQKFNVPKSATIAVAGGKITISFVIGSATKTIELSKAGESSTYYDKVKYNNGALEDIAQNATVTLRDDGQIIKSAQANNNSNDNNDNNDEDG